MQTKPSEEIEEAGTEAEKVENAEAETVNSDELTEQNEVAPQTEENQMAYMITVQYRGFSQVPKTLMVNPYGVLPDTRHELMYSDEDENDSDEAKSTFSSPFNSSPFNQNHKGIFK